MPSLWRKARTEPTADETSLLPSGAAGADTGGRGDWTANGIFSFDSRDIRSRPFNLLRSQVIKIMQANNWRVLGVTSGTPNVGKSFIASNLAAAMSRMPLVETRLFDLDFRRHSVAGIFGLTGDIGVESYLRGDVASIEQAAHPIPGTDLTVYPSYWTSGASSEVLAGSRFPALVQAMRALPGNVMCVCDLPPAFANDDAAIVVGEIDAYLLVVEEGRTTKRQLRDAIRLLSPAPCIGTVLNRYRGGIGISDYGFGYGAKDAYSAYYG